MAKIIEKGEKIYECPRCGCKFQIEKGDIKYNDYALGADGFFGLFPMMNRCTTVKCPQCFEKIVLDWN